MTEWITKKDKPKYITKKEKPELKTSQGQAGLKQKLKISLQLVHLAQAV